MKIENTQNTQNKQNQKFAKGFTLLELLVVVVIIGILAAIALPQYQMAVGKAKFSELKILTKTVQQSSQRYFLVNNKYPRKIADLDIGFDVSWENFQYNAYLSFTLTNGISCDIWKETSQPYIACSRNIFGKSVVLYVTRDIGRPAICRAGGADKTSKAHLLCKKETKCSGGSGCSNCDDNACNYVYLN